MTAYNLKKLFQLEYLVIFLILIAIAYRTAIDAQFIEALTPQRVFEHNLSLKISSQVNDITLRTYLPQGSFRQRIILENQRASNANWQDALTQGGRERTWNGKSGEYQIDYRTLVQTEAVSFYIPGDLTIDKTVQEHQDYLNESPAIAVNHPEILEKWNSIKPNNPDNLLSVLKTIYNYIMNLERLPFKGMTSSLTALRLDAASCNGKSRLFISLARLNSIPARLVGGVIMNENKKRTSHQWVEVLINDSWVPFDPSNGHFASLPENYLELYRGDQALFRHTANAQFDYQFSSKKHLVAPSFYKKLMSGDQRFNWVDVLKPLNLGNEAIIALLMFPACALLITFCKNCIGLPTFGIFVPVLITITCLNVGLIVGLLAVGSCIFLAFLVQLVLSRWRILKVPRLAVSLTAITLFLLFLVYLVSPKHLDLSVISIMPLIVLSLVAEKIFQNALEHEWRDTLLLSLGTVIVILLCYSLLSSSYLHALFSFSIEAMIFVLALQIIIGRWTGIRLSEMLRFRQLLNTHETFIGINERNRDCVYRLNSPQALSLAADKIKTKAFLEEYGIKTPKTLGLCQSLTQSKSIESAIQGLDEFVIKPNKGSQGNGILVIREKAEHSWIAANGKRWTKELLMEHIKEILVGSFSQCGDADIAYVEPLVCQHQQLNKIAPFGLADIRVIIANKSITTVMLRLPTKKSNGKANLHQGAIGCSVCVDTGRITAAKWKNRPITLHPDSNTQLLGFLIPHWDNVIGIANRVAAVFPLGYMGLDLCIDQKQGPLVLEVNGRPGLEIQNIQGKGLNREIIFPGENCA